MSNFRQSYYGKLGYKSGGADGKLDVLLDEKRVKDLSKLKLFAEDFSVSNSHRLLLWGYLSSTFPIYPNNHKYVMDQRQQQFQDLRNCVYVTHLVDDSSALEQVFHTMWSLETNSLSFGGPVTTDNSFVLIARTITLLFPETDVAHWIQYWLAKGVHDIISQIDIDGLVAVTYAELESHDSVLLKDLTRKKILDHLPIAVWMRQGFAGIVIETKLCRVWDKLFGGAPRVLAYVVLKMVQYVREKLLACDSYEAAERCFDIFIHDQEAADRIVTKALEMLEVNNKK